MSFPLNSFRLLTCPLWHNLTEKPTLAVVLANGAGGLAVVLFAL